MRNIVFATIVGIGVLLACIGVSMLLVKPPKAHAQLHNAYWPFSVELDERGVLSATEAAEMMGISRMRVNQLLNEGKLDGCKVGNTWNVYRYSVEARMA